MKSRLHLWIQVAMAFVPMGVAERTSTGQAEESYGVDVSFPIHYRVSTNYNVPSSQNNNTDSDDTSFRARTEEPLQVLGNRQDVYLNHLNGCRENFASTGNSQSCDAYEYERMLMNLRQPQSMRNMTEIGFQMVRAPEHLIKLVEDFWQANHLVQTEENWGIGNTYQNYWESPTTMVSVDDTGLRGSGSKLKREIWSDLSAVMEEWTQQELQPSSLYGVRVYSEGAVMLPHVDRLPLVASAILNVAQDVDEDWPTEIYDHQGRAHNITLHPGEMLLFESASCLHGHPFPLRGRFYASIFIHFEPTGRPLGMTNDGIFYLKGHHHENHNNKGKQRDQQVDLQYRASSQKGHGGQSSAFDGMLPPYIIRESPEEAHWLSQHPTGWEPPVEMLPPDAHIAASRGKLADLQLEFEQHGSKILTERDDNGWQVLHQGVAGGNAEVVQYLISHGAEINARTHGGYGETPLRIAEKRLGLNHSMVNYLRSLGALSIGPEL